MTSDTPDGHGDDPSVQREDDPDPLRLRTRSRWPVLVAWLAGLTAVAVVVGYVTTHPDELPTSDMPVTASTPVGQPVYIGVFAADGDFDRTLAVSGVKVFAVSTVPVTITPRLCKGGSLGVTSEPELFCADLVATEGSTMAAGDEVVLEVSADQPGVVDIERIRVAYRDGLQWDTQFAGAPAVVTVLGS